MKPWYRSRDDAWFVTLRLPDGTRKQVRLCDGADNEAEAWTQLRRYRTGQVKTPTRLTVAEAFDAFLDWASREKKPATFEHYRYFLSEIRAGCRGRTTPSESGSVTCAKSSACPKAWWPRPCATPG